MTRADVLKAIRIRKLMAQANDRGATPQEAESYRAMAEKLKARYRHGQMMRVG